MKEFNLPDLGEGLQEAEVVNWHVHEGDHVVADQPLLSVETDKAVVEVPSPWTGRIGKLIAAEGDMVATGAPLVAFDDTEEQDKGAIAGEISHKAEDVAEQPTQAPAARGGGSEVKALPAVRALANRLGIDLKMISPSGPGGVVTKGDVERVAKVLERAGELEPLRGPRRAMAKRMEQARDQVAAATIMDDADVEDWVDGGDITIRVIRAITAGCQAEPALNAWYDSDARGRRLCKVIDIGIAVDTEDGLFVPILRDVDSRDEADLRKGLEAMKSDVSDRTVPPEELRGATISYSNFGTLAGKYASPVIVPPQVAILGTGVIYEGVVAHKGKPAVRRVMPLSLTFDHRAVTGGEAARFLAAVIADLQKKA